MSLCRQRAGCLIAEHLSAAEKHGPSPALSSSINSFLLFPRPARISSLPCLAMTSKLLFGYDRLSGNRPFPPLCLNRCSYSSAEEGGVGGGGVWAEGRNYHISGWTGVPPFGMDTKTPQNYVGPQQWEVFIRHNRVHFSVNLPHASPCQVFTQQYWFTVDPGTMLPWWHGCCSILKRQKSLIPILL